VVEVATSSRASFVRCTDGSVFGWGEGGDGELGLGPTRTSASKPQQLPGVAAAGLACGRHTLCVATPAPARAVVVVGSLCGASAASLRLAPVPAPPRSDARGGAASVAASPAGAPPGAWPGISSASATFVFPPVDGSGGSSGRSVSVGGGGGGSGGSERPAAPSEGKATDGGSESKLADDEGEGDGDGDDVWAVSAPMYVGVLASVAVVQVACGEDFVFVRDVAGGLLSWCVAGTRSGQGAGGGGMGTLAWGSRRLGLLPVAGLRCSPLVSPSPASP
jgi:hypothetical protein